MTNSTTNLIAFTLDARGEVIERRVYAIWDFLADMGGFKDGLYMILGWFFFPFDSRWFFIDFNKSIFKVENREGRKKRKNSGHRKRNISIDGQRMIDTSSLTR